MAYRDRTSFDQPTAEDLDRSRKTVVWLVPLLAIQQGLSIFRDDQSLFTQLMATLAWGTVTLVVIAVLSGWNTLGLAERDRALLNDEWHRSISGDSSRWGLAASCMIGFGLMLARLWLALDAGQAVFILVNGGVVTAGLRYAWLNRGEPDGDE